MSPIVLDRDAFEYRDVEIDALTLFTSDIVPLSIKVDNSDILVITYGGAYSHHVKSCLRQHLDIQFSELLVGSLVYEGG